MYISPPNGAALSTNFTLSFASQASNDGPGGPLRNWSSEIGIVTAIVGNVLISFALNTQRYAHIRIEREHNDDKQAPEGQALSGKGGNKSYGTLQKDVAEERARLNATAPGPGKTTPLETGHGPALQSLEDPRREGSFVQSEKDDEEEHGRKSYLRSPWWWLGIILMTIGEAGNFLAYGFAPASIVSPLGVVALVSNCLIAPLMLKERFRLRDFTGVLIAIGGAVTIVLSARQSEPKLGPNDLWKHYIRRWEFLVYVLLTCVAIVALMVASPRYGRRSILVDLGLVGLFGGYTALSTKGVASLLSGNLWLAFTYPITYVLVFILVGSAIMQIRYVNRALQHYGSTQVIPVQFVLFTLSVILGSAVLYRDFEHTTTEQAIKFIAGCLLTFSGVYLITSGQRDRKDDEQEEDAGYDETIHLIDEEQEEVDGETTPTQKSRVPSKEGQYSTNLAADGLQTPRRLSAAGSTTPDIVLTPAAVSASDLSKNPWLSSTDHLEDFTIARPRTPQMSRIQSDSGSRPYYNPTPSLQPPRSRPRLGLRTPSSPANPQTLSRDKRGPSPPKADFVRGDPFAPLARSARGSLVERLTPGPFLAPFSGSLSAVVADSLLRGEGSPRSVRTALRRNRSSRISEPRRNSTVGEAPIFTKAGLSRQQTRDTLPDVREAIEADENVPQTKGRLRAMSETLTGMLGGKGKRRELDAEDANQCQQRDNHGGGSEARDPSR